MEETVCGSEVGGAPAQGHFYKLWLLLVIEARTVESQQTGQRTHFLSFDFPFT